MCTPVASWQDSTVSLVPSFKNFWAAPQQYTTVSTASGHKGLGVYSAPAATTGNPQSDPAPSAGIADLAAYDVATAAAAVTSAAALSLAANLAAWASP